MATKEFVKLVGQLSQQVVEAPNSFRPSQRNEEWTKVNFILPLLEGLGWDRLTDVNYEDSPEEVEDSLDFVLVCKPPIGIEAKALDVKSPEDRNHPHIKKGLKQSKERGASYFIWTNGDCWQFFSLNIPDAPVYGVTLSNARSNTEQIEGIVSEFCIIEKKRFATNPKLFDECIREKWKKEALPAALDMLLKEPTNDLLRLIRQCLPSELGIEDKEIMTFLKLLKPLCSPTGHITRRTRQNKKDHSFPDD